jgi:hypothetical protein
MIETTGTTDTFSFVNDGRTFACTVEGTSARGLWWWFTVSTESYQRHAPFPAVEGDTRGDVERRVVAYYDNLIARRNAPYQSRWQGRPSNRPASASPVEATPPAT